MNNFESTLDNETVKSTFNQIHYYNNLPKHIKGMAIELRSSSNNEGDMPAHVIEGTLTVKMGKMNIPAVNYHNQFANKTTNYFTDS